MAMDMVMESTATEEKSSKSTYLKEEKKWKNKKAALQERLLQVFF